jgi:hypothetical protein
MDRALDDCEEITEMLLRFGWGGTLLGEGAVGDPLDEGTVATPLRLVLTQLLELAGEVEEPTEPMTGGSWDEIPLGQLALTVARPPLRGAARSWRSEAGPWTPRPHGLRTPPPPAPPPPPFVWEGLGPTRWWARWVGVAAAMFSLLQTAWTGGLPR